MVKDIQSSNNKDVIGSDNVIELGKEEKYTIEDKSNTR